MAEPSLSAAAGGSETIQSNSLLLPPPSKLTPLTPPPPPPPRARGAALRHVDGERVGHGAEQLLEVARRERAARRALDREAHRREEGGLRARAAQHERALDGDEGVEELDEVGGQRERRRC